MIEDLDEHLAVARLGNGLLGVLPIAGLGQADRTGGEAELMIDEVHCVPFVGVVEAP